jgi:hypothetical protein
MGVRSVAARPDGLDASGAVERPSRSTASRSPGADGDLSKVPVREQGACIPESHAGGPGPGQAGSCQQGDHAR